MGKKSADAPDYRGAAEEQAKSSKEAINMQTWANRADQITPFGNQNWTTQKVRDPATGQMMTKWVQRTTLDPDMQRSLDAQQGLQTGRSELAGSMIDRIRNEFSKAPNYKGMHARGADVKGREVGGQGAYMSKAGDALMSQFDARMQPAFQQATAELETQMRNRGLKPGDEAYDRGLAQLRQQQGDQRSNAMYEAQKMQGAEAARMQGMDIGSAGLGFQQDMAASQYANQQRQGEIGEMLQQRGTSLNEANALITGQQVQNPDMPSYNTAAAAQPTNYMGAAQAQYSADQDAANVQNAAVGNIVGAVAAPMKMSDRRLKREIEQIGVGYAGLPLYTFKYKGGDETVHVGYMADEVELQFPDAIRIYSGYKAVDYGKVPV